MTYDLIQTLGGTQTSRASANDENVNGTKGIGLDGSLEGVEEGNVHVGVGHPALKEVLEAGHAFESLASDVQHRRKPSSSRLQETGEGGRG